MDYSNLSPELKAKIEKWDAESPAGKTLSTLQDIESSIEQLVITLENDQSKDEQAVKQFSSLVLDIRESISALAAKEAPETPDFAKPIVESLSKLEAALAASLKAVSDRPTPEIQVSAPNVNVSAPQVDLAGMERIVKQIPGAFQTAIDNLPQPEPTDLSPLADRLDQALEKLDSIDTGTRMKPLPPSSMKVIPPGFADDHNLSTDIVTVGSVKTITSTDGANTRTVTVDSTNPADMVITRVWS